MAFLFGFLDDPAFCGGSHAFAKAILLLVSWCFFNPITDYASNSKFTPISSLLNK
jgi:hypothetical protein